MAIPCTCMGACLPAKSQYHSVRPIPFPVLHPSRKRMVNYAANGATASSNNQRLLQSVFKAGAICTALAVIAAPATRAAEVFGGVPRVVDGDTIEVDGRKVRLYGIDAPESKQSCRDANGNQYSCGLEAAERLRAVVGGDPVRCQVQATDQYKRSVAVCSTPKVQLNQWMVDQGQAVAYRQYGTEYVAAEEAAHSAHRGLWAGAFDVPSDWRKERKIQQLEKGLSRSKPAVDGQLSSSAGRGFQPVPSQPPSLQHQPPNQTSAGAGGSQPSCPNILIKGNISAKGVKIYHKPGDRAYASVQINTSAGERYFCSEQDALDAGWRASK